MVIFNGIKDSDTVIQEGIPISSIPDELIETALKFFPGEPLNAKTLEAAEKLLEKH